MLGVVVLWYTRSPIRSSLAQEMIARAEQDSRVQDALGSPVRTGLLASGGIVIDETGWSEAKLSIPLKGSHASGTLRVIGGRGDGPWVVSTLEVWVEEQKAPINLLRGKVEVSGEQAYLSIHTQPAVVPQIISTVAAPPDSDGSYPVARIALDPSNAEVFSVSQRSMHFLNPPENMFEVDLRTGVFILRRTDLVVPDSTPVAFTRVFHTWGLPNWGRSGNWAYATGDAHPAFGSGSTHSFDICPMGTRNPYTFMDLYTADGTFVHLARISEGTGYGDAWYEHRDTSSEFYKSRFWWNGDGWTLHLEDGRQYQFPESYSGKNLAQGAPFEIRDAAGQRLQLIRDPQRNLRQIVSQSGRSIRLEYDAHGRVQRAQDDTGHLVTYDYDSMDRLIQVSDDGRPSFHYRYDDPGSIDKMTAIEDGRGRTILQNHYNREGRVAEQILADGTIYRYRYVLDRSDHVAQTIVTGPDRKDVEFLFGKLFAESTKMPRESPSPRP